MAAKKSILFVNESLACAGGEKSLLTLLSALDYNRFDVYLQLMTYGKPWEKFIPTDVHLLRPLDYCLFTSLPIWEAISFAFRTNKLNWLFSRCIYSAFLRIFPNLNNLKKALLYWMLQGRCFKLDDKEYDYVIAYAHNWPTFYVSDKTNARIKRLAWINATYAPKYCKKYIENKYTKYDNIVAVSEVIADTVSAHFFKLKGKISTFRDLISPEIIYKLSKESIELKANTGGLTIVTLGRINPQKGYDISIEAARILKNKGINYKWYILGSGSIDNQICSMISDYNLKDYVYMLGVKENPYPYLKLADIYVQTSRYEGFGLAIAEARLLNIPVVTTKFNTVYMQMVDEKNGLVADMNGNAVAEAIIRLWEDKSLYRNIKDYLEKEPKGNLDTIGNFYKLLELDDQA